MPKVLILCLCALLYLIPAHSILLKDSSNTGSLASNHFLPPAKHHSVEDIVSSILEDNKLPFIETELTTTISPEEAKEQDKQIQQDIITKIANPQNDKGSQNDIQNNQINTKTTQNYANSIRHEDLDNTKDSQELLASQGSSTAHSDVIEPHSNELSLNESENQENAFGRQSLAEKSVTVDVKNNIDVEVEETQEQLANEILQNSESLEQKLETTEDNLRSSSLGSTNEKSEIEKSNASEKNPEKIVEKSQGNLSASVGKSGRPHSRDIFVQTGQGDEYFHKGPIFILGVGIVIVIILAFRMMTEEIDGKIQEYDEERDSLMTS